MRASRRSVLAFAGSAAAGAAGFFEFYRRRKIGAPKPEPPRQTVRPEGIPLSSFEMGSTGEAVTVGLDLAGKTILVTGATSGIGLETMRVLALRGAHVIGTGRSQDKAGTACASVLGRTTPVALELTDYPGVVECAAQIRRMGVALDGIICNAGVMGLRKLDKVEGVEKHFATNHLGHFLLVRHLLDLLQAAPNGRVAVVSSYVMSWSEPTGIEWDNLSGDHLYHHARAYGQSKLANALFSFELARRFRGTNATSNSLEPGYVDTALFRHFPVSLTGFRGLFSKDDKMTVQQGAATSCYLASAPILAGVSGYHFANCNPVLPIRRARDPVAAERLWAVSERQLARYLPAG